MRWGAVKRSRKKPKPGAITVKPSLWGMTSRISTARRSPGSAPSTETGPVSGGPARDSRPGDRAPSLSGRSGNRRNPGSGFRLRPRRRCRSSAECPDASDCVPDLVDPREARFYQLERSASASAQTPICRRWRERAKRIPPMRSRANASARHSPIARAVNEPNSVQVVRQAGVSRRRCAAS